MITEEEYRKRRQTITVAALVRAFFSAFTEGVLSESVKHDDEAVDMTPQIMKQTMLEHYENISKYYFDILFNPFALVYYDTAEELIQILRSPDVAPTLKTPVDLFTHVCRTLEAHENMVTEYRRNFTSLLSGRVLSVEDFFEGFPKEFLVEEKNDNDKMVRILTQTTVRAFFAGRQEVMKDKGTPSSSGVNQIYIFRQLIGNMQCMLHAAPLEFSDDADLNEMFLKVCRTPKNMNTMLATMQETMAEVMGK